MKVPKQMNRYCPNCKKKTEHKVVPIKNKPRPKTKKHGLKWGVRHVSKILAGYGGYPRSKADKSKVSTHPSFKLTCSVCKKSSIKAYSDRAKKVSQV